MRGVELERLAIQLPRLVLILGPPGVGQAQSPSGSLCGGLVASSSSFRPDRKPSMSPRLPLNLHRATPRVLSAGWQSDDRYGVSTSTAFCQSPTAIASVAILVASSAFSRSYPSTKSRCSISAWISSGLQVSAVFRDIGPQAVVHSRELAIGPFQHGGNRGELSQDSRRHLEAALVGHVVTDVGPGVLQDRSHLDLRLEGSIGGVSSPKQTPRGFPREYPCWETPPA